MKISKRSDISPFIVMDVMAAAAAREAAGERVLHLEVGQPATPAPRAVLAAAEQALREDRIGYTVALGIPELRERLAHYYQTQYGVCISPERIVVTTGSSAGFLLSFLAHFDAGDRVAICDPGYPAYRNILKVLNLEPVLIPCRAESDFRLTVPQIAQAAKDGGLDGLLIASPANPTGAMLSPDELRAIADYCATQNITLISDEIYHGISYGKAAQTALAVSDDAVVINSFSKYFSMTGWRLGWMVVPQAALRAVERIAQNLFISPPTLSQLAAVAAFDCEAELQENVAVYARNRGLLLRELPKAGIDRFAPPDGAFYLYADVSRFTDDSVRFCQDMLLQTGVAATPGTDFDVVEGHKFVRFSFAGATEVMAEAAKRLAGWLPDST
ncbi:MAG TPA: 1-aminocyclopropane-1-carboxylate deaminase [Alphaproteobacteria bacterium]|nr:1-aminocyclopropane-1-carboxylate deaminase [Alphaproteobacteria bacterium]HAM47914.1 1-aminocyclopropane-1-carboxylate deaminase [Alphaproteobacteria bacterium]HBA43269.1 1-aminocyclopropane-1-carboxylate deaminase [Alphaproteobacteria bacterium]HBC52935.1 1-aminocyclopropane-1-carboxylate deaminase [Alphaproteobacteria bacterium]